MKIFNKISRRVDKWTAVPRPDIDAVYKDVEALNTAFEQAKKSESSHPMVAEEKYLQGWIDRLEHDPPRYIFILDYLLVPGNLQKDRERFVDAFKDAKFINRILHIVAKHMKGDIPNREEMNAIEALIHKLDNDQLYDPDIRTFAQNIREEIFDHLLTLRKKYPGSKALRDLLVEIQKAQEVQHLAKYVDEIHYLEGILQKMKDDDDNWTFFRTQFYPKRKDFTDTLSRRFSDPRYAKIILQFFEQHKEDKVGTEQRLRIMIDRMSSPEMRKKEENEGILQLRKIMEQIKVFFKGQLESLRRELLAVCRRHLNLLTAGKEKFVQKSEKIVKKETRLIEEIAGASFRLAKQPKPEELAPIQQLIAQPERFKLGMAKLKALEREEKIGKMAMLTWIWRLAESRINYNKKMIAQIREIYLKRFNSETQRQASQAFDAVRWYDKEIAAMAKEMLRLESEVSRIQRLQRIFIKELQDVTEKAKKDLAKDLPTEAKPAESAEAAKSAEMTRQPEPMREAA